MVVYCVCDDVISIFFIYSRVILNNVFFLYDAHQLHISTIAIATLESTLHLIQFVDRVALSMLQVSGFMEGCVRRNDRQLIPVAVFTFWHEIFSQLDAHNGQHVHHTH